MRSKLSVLPLVFAGLFSLNALSIKQQCSLPLSKEALKALTWTKALESAVSSAINNIRLSDFVKSLKPAQREEFLSAIEEMAVGGRASVSIMGSYCKALLNSRDPKASYRGLSARQLKHVVTALAPREQDYFATFMNEVLQGVLQGRSLSESLRFTYHDYPGAEKILGAIFKDLDIRT